MMLSAQVPIPTPAEAIPRKSSRKAPRVIVAEPHVSLRRLLSATLADCGYRVVEASTCSQMRRALETPCDAESPIRLVVVDHDLIDGSGIVALETARAYGWRGPAILVLPFAGVQELDEAKTVPDSLVLGRPFDGRQLRNWARALVPMPHAAETAAKTHR